MLNEIFGNKPWFKSLTAWATVILTMAWTVIPALGETGIISPEVTTVAAGWMTKVSLILGTLGIRKAATTKNVQ